MENCKISQWFFRMGCCKVQLLETWGLSLNNLIIRFWIGLVFWKSAVSKVVADSFWGLPDSVNIFGYQFPLMPMPYEITSGTYALFEYEYQVPYLSPEFATQISTLAEVVFALMLFFGFGGRLAALGLFIMTLVIHFTYDSHASHYVWMMLLAVILTTGSGRFSLDYLCRRFCGKCWNGACER